MMSRKKFSAGLTLIELIIIIALAGIVGSIIWFSVKSVQRKKAVITLKENIMTIRGDITICASEISGVLKSGVTGESICDNGIGKYPEVPIGCGEKPVFYFIDSRAETWKLTTATDSKGKTDWDCHGCRPICQANGCTYIETNPGDCY